MAPVTATTIGVPHQPIDDPDLISFIDRLRVYARSTQCSNDNDVGLDIEGLVGELEKRIHWDFSEQVSFEFLCF